MVELNDRRAGQISFAVDLAGSGRGKVTVTGFFFIQQGQLRLKEKFRI